MIMEKNIQVEQPDQTQPPYHYIYVTNFKNHHRYVEENKNSE